MRQPRESNLGSIFDIRFGNERYTAVVERGFEPQKMESPAPLAKDRAFKMVGMGTHGFWPNIPALATVFLVLALNSTRRLRFFGLPGKPPFDFDLKR
jgi:hypothetical protein